MEKIDALAKRTSKILQGGGAEKINQQHQQGKLTARERLDLLFDEGTFVEIGAFVHSGHSGMETETGEGIGAGVITGYGKIDGRLVHAYAQDVTVLGGAIGKAHVNKICRIYEHALKMGTPLVGLQDSGGARLQEGIEAVAGYGQMFRVITKASGVIPQIVAVMGASSGAAAFSSGLADFVFMVDPTSHMYVNAPLVLNAERGEPLTPEQLGGASVHSKATGVAHFVLEDDPSCIKEIQNLLRFLPSNNLDFVPQWDIEPHPEREIESLNTCIHTELTDDAFPYSMFEIIRALVDEGAILEYLSTYAQNCITCFSRIDGRTVGIVGNNPACMDGSLDLQSSEKISRFVRTCDCFNLPILTLVDSPGFLPDVQQEHGGLVKHGAKMIYAFAEATVPKVTMIIKRAYGSSYTAMCPKELGADLVIAWPTADISFMNPPAAARILYRDQIAQAVDPVEATKHFVEQYEREQAGPYKAGEIGILDEIIEPSTSRMRLIEAFDMLSTKRESLPGKKHGNIPL